MNSRRWVVLLFVVVLIAAACGGGGEGADTSAPDTDQTSDGDSDNQGGSEGGGGGPMTAGDLPNSVPDDFPIAIPSGWEVDFNDEIGLTVSSTRLFYSVDDFDAIVAFYDAWTSAQSDQYTKSVGDDGIVIFTGSSAGGQPRQIFIEPNHEERGETWTLLTATGAAEG